MMAFYHFIFILQSLYNFSILLIALVEFFRIFDRVIIIRYAFTCGEIKMMIKSLLRPKALISNLQMIIDGSRVLEHKKYQLNNQVQFGSLSNQLPSKFLEKNEIETRILKLLYESELVDISDFSFSQDIRKEYYLDSLDITALVSSIEEQFGTIFDDDTYENARSLDVIVQALANDDSIV